MKLNALSAGSECTIQLIFSGRDIISAVENTPDFSVYLEAAKKAVIANKRVEEAEADDAINEEEFGRLLDARTSIERHAEREGARLMETAEVGHLIENPYQNERLGSYPIIGWDLPEDTNDIPRPITLMNENQMGQGYYEVRCADSKLIYDGNLYFPLSRESIRSSISYFLTYRIWEENKLSELGFQY